MKELPGKAFGAHRVASPAGALPQNAWQLDNNTSLHFDNEIIVDVDVLNIDASSFKQMLELSQGSAAGVAAIVEKTVKERGKQHNPVTGSGGMLLGRIKRVGSALTGQEGHSSHPHSGSQIATLVSLTLTPLRIDEIIDVNVKSCQIQVRAEAIVFDTSPFAVMPDDISPHTALAALDVAGVVPQVSRLCRPGESVLIVGAGGKSGLLAQCAARLAVGARGHVIGVEGMESAALEARNLGFCDEVIIADATQPLEVYERVLAANRRGDFDVSVMCVNVPGAEMSAVLPLRQRGRAYFFSMTTSFTAAALGAEGVGKDIDLFIGNGFAENHAIETLDILRNNKKLLELFTCRYGG